MTADEMKDHHRVAGLIAEEAIGEVEELAASFPQYAKALSHLRAGLQALHEITMPEDKESRALNHGDELRGLAEGR